MAMNPRTAFPGDILGAKTRQICAAEAAFITRTPYTFVIGVMVMEATKGLLRSKSA